MSIRKALGIIVFSTQAVVVIDYNMQSHKAGLSPGALSMKDYVAIVQQRYEAPDSGRFADLSMASDPDTAASVATLTKAEAAQGTAPDAPAGVCIRRGTALYCQ